MAEAIGVLTYERHTGKFKANTQQQRSVEMQMKIDRLLPYIDLFQKALAEPYFVPDAVKRWSVMDYIFNILQTGGQFFIIKEDGVPIGFHILGGIDLGHKAHWGMFLVSEKRGTGIFELAAAELMSYCFDDDYKDNLGLIKLMAQVAVPNVAGVKALWGKLRADHAGRLRYDAFYDGTPCDTLLFELFNPCLKGDSDEREQPMELQQQSGGGAELCSTAGLQCDDTQSGDSSGLGESGVSSEQCATS